MFICRSCSVGGMAVPSAVVTSSMSLYSVHMRLITSSCSRVSRTASFSWAPHSTYAANTWQCNPTGEGPYKAQERAAQSLYLLCFSSWFTTRWTQFSLHFSIDRY